MSFRIASCNPLYPAYAEANKQKEGIDDKGKCNWDKVRKFDFAKNMLAIDADILLVQEMDSIGLSSLYNQYAPLKYWAFITTHHFSNKAKDDYSAQELGRWDGIGMFYKYDRFQGTTKDARFKDVDFEYSVVAKPFKKCVKHTYFDLVDSITKKVVRVANCHLLSKDHVNSPQHLDVVLKTLDAPPLPNFPIAAQILGGDFNADETDERFKKMCEKYKFDGDLSGTEHASGKKKDWIWVKQQLETDGDPLLMQHVPVKVPCPSASHHLPTVTECVFASSISRKFFELEATEKVKTNQGPILEALLRDKEITQASGNSISKLKEAFQKKMVSLEETMKSLAISRLEKTLVALFKDRTK